MKPKPSNHAPSSLSAIRNFRPIGERFGTSGQPTEEQFQAIREAGFEAVINLALPTSDHALAHEGGIVTGLGLAYVHLPVNFESPASRDFQAFRRVLEAFEDRRVFVHCAMNMRVSAFMFLYRVLHEKVAVAEAERDLHAIWQPDKTWSRFIKNELQRSANKVSRPVRPVGRGVLTAPRRKRRDVSELAGTSPRRAEDSAALPAPGGRKPSTNRRA